MKVIIPKDTKIFSTHPNKPEIISTKEQTVTNVHSKEDYLKWCTEIEWAGTGGYWRWTEINDKILDVNPKLKEWIDQRNNQ